VQGTSSLTEVPILYFIKFTLVMGDAGGQLFDSLRSIGWFVKPVWGFLSDRFPLFGYHRKSWFILMACLALVFWISAALLSYLDVRISLVYLIVFNLAFATYAFVDVVCDALMVTEGRRLKRVGSFINFQWTVLASANAGALFLGGWLQGNIQRGDLKPWVVFALAAIPPLLTAYIGAFHIIEERKARSEGSRFGEKARPFNERVSRLATHMQQLPDRFRQFCRDNRVLWLLTLFIFFWKFSPSVGFIERSYLIDERAFTAQSFGVILSVGGVTFLISILAYRWLVRTLRGIGWHHYLYAMVVLGVVSFPLSFFLYLDPEHPWWEAVYFTIPEILNPLPHWNRYQWFRLITGTVLGFASIPAFIIPLTIAGETVKVSHAGMAYAFLMSFSNLSNMFEGMVGAGLYGLLASSSFDWIRGAFRASIFEIAGSTDTRTLILEFFVYVSLFFTLLTIPFIELLKREMRRQKIVVELSGPAT
jgi:hypothetical protein